MAGPHERQGARAREGRHDPVGDLRGEHELIPLGDRHSRASCEQIARQERGSLEKHDEMLGYAEARGGDGNEPEQKTRPLAQDVEERCEGEQHEERSVEAAHRQLRRGIEPHVVDDPGRRGARPDHEHDIAQGAQHLGRRTPHVLKPHDHRSSSETHQRARGDDDGDRPAIGRQQTLDRALGAPISEHGENRRAGKRDGRLAEGDAAFADPRPPGTEPGNTAKDE